MAMQSTKLDPANYPQAPSNLTLEQVHVYFRHGERTPVGVRLQHPPASIPEHWPLCQAGQKFSTAVWESSPTSDDVYSDPVRLERVVESRDSSSMPGVCMLGELTDVGRQSTHDFGRALRKLYIERLGLLSDVFEDHSSVYYRSTNVPRTIESLQQSIKGLYPDSKSKSRAHLRVRNAKDELNHTNCKRLQGLAVAFQKAAAEKLNHTLEPLDKRLSQYLGGEPVRIDGKPRASGILDTIRAAKAHGFSVPRDFDDPEVMGLIEHAVVTEWFGGYKSPEYRRLAMGPLLDDLQRKMQKKVDDGNKEQLKLLVYSTHDTVLAGVLSSLDTFDHRWPEFTASVTFELFKQAAPPVAQQASLLGLNLSWAWGGLGQSSTNKSKVADSPEHYVRVRYRNQNLVPPFCAKAGNHLPGSPEFCTLKAFREHVKELTPDDWDAECLPPRVKTTL